MTDPKKILRALTVLLGVIVIALLAWRVLKGPKTNDPLESTIYGPVRDFSLVDQSGKPFGLSDLKGKTWVADFVFTRCMGPCPLITRRMAELQKKFAAKKDLAFVSFSVDPEFDKPNVLKDYAATYHADLSNWHFLTGPKPELIGLITGSFHLAVSPGENNAPGVIDILHSTYFVLVDDEGKTQGYFNSTDDEAVAKLERNLAALR